jgi:chloramphenicol O-acetyltransferase type A
MYKVIKKEELKKLKQYEWFKTFANPCYGFDVKMDVSEVVKYSKETNTSFFINVLYLITIGLSSVEEMRIREVDGEIRLYEQINPTFTVMTKTGVYENAGFEMIQDYKGFYKKAYEVLQSVKNQDFVKETYNDSTLFNDYYMTCIPWLSIESMTHPLCDNNHSSSSCPRICWDKYRIENDKYIMLLNITVSHCFVDGYPLTVAFKNIQSNFNNIYDLVNKSFN